MTLDESIKMAVELLTEKEKTVAEIAELTGLTAGAIEDLKQQVLSEEDEI